jgi:hypothetical protein
VKAKRLSLCLILAALAVLSTGCVWLRLLSFKNQLASLDRYVRVENTNGLTIHFLKPVLNGEDLFMFAGDQPTSSTTNQNRRTWTWTYQKLSPSTNREPANFHLNFQVLLGETKIDGFRFPDQVLAVLPQPMILGLLRSLGRAQIDRKGGSLKFQSTDLDESKDALRFTWTDAGPGKEFEPITKDKVLTVLGIPFFTATNETYSCLYKYRFVGPSPDSAWAKFTFDRTGNLQVSEGAMSNVGWKLTALPDNRGMQGLVFFQPPTPAPPAATYTNNIGPDYVGRYQAPSGDQLSVGRDGDLLAVDSGFSPVETSRCGWWKLFPQSTTNFAGRGLSFTFLHDAAGRLNRLRVNERGFDVEYAKISDQGPMPPITVPLPAATADRYLGRYRASWSGDIITVRREADQLLWDGIKIYPTSEMDFAFKLADCSLTFMKNGKGQVTGFVLHYLDVNLTAEKMK